MNVGDFLEYTQGSKENMLNHVSPRLGVFNINICLISAQRIEEPHIAQEGSLGYLWATVKPRKALRAISRQW